MNEITLRNRWLKFDTKFFLTTREVKIKSELKQKYLLFRSGKLKIHGFLFHHLKLESRLNVLVDNFLYNLQVTFLNEPGEGSGVARGFYTALAEAVLTNTRLPNLDLAQAVASGSTASLTAAASKSMQFSLIQRLRGTRDPSRLGRSSSSTSGSGSKSSSSRTAREISRLSFDARSFVMNGNYTFFLLFIL